MPKELSNDPNQLDLFNDFNTVTRLGLPVESEQEWALRARAPPYQKGELRNCARIGDLRLYGGVDLFINKDLHLDEHLGSERPFWVVEQDFPA